MNEISEELKSKSHFGQRIFGGIDRAYVEDLIGAEFDLLFGAGGRKLEVAIDDDASSSGDELTEFAERGFNDNLEVTGAAAVVDFEEGEGVLVSFPTSLDPAANARLPAGQTRAAVRTGNDGADRDAVRELRLWYLVVESGDCELVRRRRRCVCHCS